MLLLRILDYLLAAKDLCLPRVGSSVKIGNICIIESSSTWEIMVLTLVSNFVVTRICTTPLFTIFSPCGSVNLTI